MVNRISILGFIDIQSWNLHLPKVENGLNEISMTVDSEITASGLLLIHIWNYIFPKNENFCIKTRKNVENLVSKLGFTTSKDGTPYFQIWKNVLIIA